MSVESQTTTHAPDSCPSCRRDFKSMYDFPMVRVEDVKRKEIPNDLVLQEEGRLYVDPKGTPGNEKISPDIAERFNDKSQVVKIKNGDFESEILIVDGYQWRKREYGNQALYSRAQVIIGGAELIVPVIEPFVQRLESFVGRELPSHELTPPDISFELKPGIPIHLPKDPLKFAERVSQGQRQVDLGVYSHGGRAPGGILLNKLMDVASMKYEGRIFS